MFSRPDSPPPRQPSPDLVHTPLTPPRRHATPTRPLATSRSCDRFNPGEQPPSGRSLSFSRSCENMRSRDDELSPETPTQRTPLSPSRTRARHISFFPSPTATELAPPVPPLPLYLRNYQDDSDTEKSAESSWEGPEGRPRPQSIHTSSSNGSLRQKSKTPPPEPSTRRSSRLVSLTRLKFFSWRGITHYPSSQRQQ